MDMSAHACNLSTQEAEKGSSEFKAYYGGQATELPKPLVSHTWRISHSHLFGNCSTREIVGTYLTLILQVRYL